MLELIITQPKTGLTTFTKAKTYSSSFDVAVTTTDNAAQLSLADGEVASGSKMGRLAAGKKLLPLPLEARVGKSAFAAAQQPRWSRCSRAGASRSHAAKATVNLRQQVKAKATGSYRKVFFVTLSTDTVGARRRIRENQGDTRSEAR